MIIELASNRASSTLMKKIMIMKSVSMPTQIGSYYKETLLLNDDPQILIWMMKSKLFPKIIQHIEGVI